MSEITFHQLEISDKDLIRDIEDNTGVSINIKEEDNFNEFEKYIYTEKEDKIRDVCLIQGLRDIKTCNVIWLNMDTSRKNIISQATDYALEVLGMEEAFIKVDASNTSLIKYLENNNFESLGEENGSIIFLRDKVVNQEKNRTL